jgi:tricorn protease
MMIKPLKMISQPKFAGLLCYLLIFINQVPAQGVEGYYQYPDIHKNTLVFAAEGDIWSVSIEGGLARRLTTHIEDELHPSISPDGKTLAYTASYEGPTEVYTMSMEGGLPKRWTYSEGSRAIGWTPTGELIYRTSELSKLPNAQIITMDLTTKARSVIPLHQVNDGIQTETGSWFFVPLSGMNDNIKRYKGGWARQIWKFDGTNEAVKLTTDHFGESFNPMWYEGRVYFITDRDGMKNIWSMDAGGKDLKQHTSHVDFDVRSAHLDNGKIVYQHAADLWLFDVASEEYNKLDIRLATDGEHLQETWVEKPSKYFTSLRPNPTGEMVVVTTRGRVFVVPVHSGRTIAFREQNDPVIRYRDALFSADGEDIITLSDQSGEFEFVQFPADGRGEVTPITRDAKRLRYQGIPSPDGKWIAFDDVDKNMYILNVSTGESKKISTNNEKIRDFSWAPDSQWLAFVQRAPNRLYQIKVYNVNDGSTFNLTNDRSNNYNVKWDPNGEFIYFLSDRSFRTLIGRVRGARRGGVHWDKKESVYHVGLKAGIPSPFREEDELMDQANNEEGSESELAVHIDAANIQSRTLKVPIPSGNYDYMEVNDKAIYLLSKETGPNAKNHLKLAKFTNQNPGLEDMASKINGFKMTQNGKKLLIKQQQSYYMVNAGTGSVSLRDPIDFSGCKFSLQPREDWKQLYKDAWRMERDYFYDKNMHGVDWAAMYDKYLPLVDRVTTRKELNDVLARLVGELSALHAGARGGDMPGDDKNIHVGTLGAKTSRDEAAGGFSIDYIFKSDPDYPNGKSPLDDHYLDIRAGDIITKVNGIAALSVLDLGELLRNKAGKQVRLTLKRGSKTREVIVKPKSNSYWLRYGDWEYHNRLKVEKESDEEIGYVHLSGMREWDIGHFYREFYPVFNKKGLIIDMRYNTGGWVDPIILERLLRRPWMYRIDRTGEPRGNMDHAFGGHMVVLVNERTGSDGEIFTEGFKRLGLGTTIGVRTWGGVISLNSRNRLTDKGIATAPMHGAYGLDGKWLPEGWGHEPDIKVENLPHETFHGKDAQLDAAIHFLLEKIDADPGDIPPVPDYPNKSFKNNQKN